MMKLALTLEADSVNVQALNMGRIVVDIDGVNLAELINMVCDNGYSLRVVDESDRTSADCTPPFVALTGIRCSTAHITETDNAWLYSLSHQTNDTGESEYPALFPWLMISCCEFPDYQSKVGKPGRYPALASR